MASSVVDRQIKMGRLLDNGKHWQAASALRVPGEDIKKDRAPWKRLEQHEAFYTLPHHRKKQAIIRDAFEDQGRDRYVERLEWCGFPDPVNGVRYCRVRTCPICQWRRSQMWTAKTLKHVPGAILAHPNARYGLLTLTVKNCDVTQIRQTSQEMTDGWGRLHRRHPLKTRLLGYAWGLEVTRRFDRSAHPHLHVLVMGKTTLASGPNYVGKSKWTALWQESMRLDYEPIVHFKWFPKKREPKQELSQIVGTIRYLTKEKDCTVDFEWFAEMASQVHHLKAIGLGGALKKAFIKHEDLLGSADRFVEDSRGAFVPHPNLPDYAMAHF
jgi:Replication protein